MAQIDIRSGEDLQGKRFGCLVAVEFSHRENKHTYWRCKCDCGKETIVDRQKLRSGMTKSCGHLRADSVKMKRGGYHKVEVSEEAKAWIIKHFKHTKNQDIKDKFGLTDGWLHRFARAKGLKKSAQFMHKTQEEVTAKAKAAHINNGTFPPKGYIIPRSEEFRFKAGVTPEQRLGKRRNQKRIESATKAMRELRIAEKVRLMAGIPKKTNLNIKLYREPHTVHAQRCYLRKRGYMIERGSRTAYWNEETNRSPQIERRRNGDKHYCWWDFRPISERA